MKDFDPVGDLSRTLGEFQRYHKLGTWMYRATKARRLRSQVEALYGPAVAQDVVDAITAGKDHRGILERAERARQAQQERDDLLASPPPVHGSGRWAEEGEMAGYLKGREALDNSRSLVLGTFQGQGGPRFFHWDEAGHLLTIAPTRSGKGVTTIIPNLLRYRGSAIVLDPKGELYAATSKWRRENVGPVYRLAPFDDGAKGFPRHGYNPLSRVRSQADARALAEMMFPGDAHASAFFIEDAVAFVTATILYVKRKCPPPFRHLGSVRRFLSAPVDDLRAFASLMAQQKDMPGVQEAANNVLGKDRGKALPTLRDTLNSKLSVWSDEGIHWTCSHHDFDFEDLKDRSATVYIDVPFDLMAPYAPWLKVILRSALGAMTRNPTIPDIPVLFVLDEFLSLGPFHAFRDAIRTHAGAGVRLWFFLQDEGALFEHYPYDAWRPFFNCSVKQFFGVDDPLTGELVGRYLGQTTVAYRSLSGHRNDYSAEPSESVSLAGRPLLTPDEVMAMLSGWTGQGVRSSILQVRGLRPVRLILTDYALSATLRERVGSYTEPKEPQ